MGFSAWKRIAALALCMLMLVMIIPVMAREADAAESNAYAAAVKAIDAKNPKTQKQLTLYDSKTRKKKFGVCSICSMTSLLNRRLAYDNKSGSFDAENVMKTCCKDKNVTLDEKNSRIYARGYDSTWYEKTYKLNNDTSYKAKKISINGKTKSNEGLYQYIATLLHDHPEGITIRCWYGEAGKKKNEGHVILIKNYFVENGAIKLCVFDPARTKAVYLEDSYLYDRCGTKNLYKYAQFISYLDGSKKISPISISANVLIPESFFSSTASSRIIPYRASISVLSGAKNATFSSSNKAVCTVDNKGNVVAKGAGTCEITCKLSACNQSYKTKITVWGNTPPKLKSVKNVSKRKVELKWDKDSLADGYEIQYSTSSSFGSGCKIISVNSSKTTSKTISSLGLWKTYYFRIRGYKKVAGQKVYSPWGSASKVKIGK